MSLRFVWGHLSKKTSELEFILDWCQLTCSPGDRWLWKKAYIKSVLSTTPVLELDGRLQTEQKTVGGEPLETAFHSQKHCLWPGTPSGHVLSSTKGGKSCWTLSGQSWARRQPHHRRCSLASSRVYHRRGVFRLLRRQKRTSAPSDSLSKLTKPDRLRWVSGWKGGQRNSGLHCKDDTSTVSCQHWHCLLPGY